MALDDEQRSLDALGMTIFVVRHGAPTKEKVPTPAQRGTFPLTSATHAIALHMTDGDRSTSQTSHPCGKPPMPMAQGFSAILPTSRRLVVIGAQKAS